MFRWSISKQSFMREAQVMRPLVLASELYLQSERTLSGYCWACDEITQFDVDVGVHFADNVNLREGLVCSHCRLSNRNRLIYLAITSEMADAGSVSSAAILEFRSPLFHLLNAKFPSIQGSEFIDESCEPGQVYDYQGAQVRHETITSLSYPNESLDLIAHNDVLEHVFDYMLALRECQRVLKTGGILLFTMPFFMNQDLHLLRGRPLADGTLEHFLPPEYHGDPMHHEGAYTFHYFGWQLLKDLHTAGFETAEIGIYYDVFAGHTSSNFPSWEGVMLPIVFRARKGGGV